jgi:hypothetical protein
MPNGVTGEASSVAFDSSSGLLTLSGSEENPVKLTMTNGGTFSITAKAEITLDANSLGGAMPVLTTLGSRY